MVAVYGQEPLHQASGVELASRSRMTHLWGPCPERQRGWKPCEENKYICLYTAVPPGAGTWQTLVFSFSFFSVNKI